MFVSGVQSAVRVKVSHKLLRMLRPQEAKMEEVMSRFIAVMIQQVISAGFNILQREDHADLHL